MSRELVVGARDLVLRERGRQLACEPFDNAQAPLQAALHRILAGRPGAPLTALVAASHVRMLLLPWVAPLTRRERWQSLAASRFEQTFGQAPDGWVLRVADDLPPRARLAAALPEALLGCLRAAAPLRSVRIAVLEGLGALLQREPAFSGCVAQVATDHACLLMLWRGELRRIRTRRFEALDDLAAAARSEWVAARGSESKGAGDAVALATVGPCQGIAAQLAGAIGCRRVLEL
jgi:hypothetical protein